MPSILPASLIGGFLYLWLLYGSVSSRGVEATALARDEQLHEDFEHGVLISDESWQEFNASSLAFSPSQALSFVNDWCNMPHVTKEIYSAPSSEFVLKYVEVIQRHHKRTPYDSNLFYQEDTRWDCSGVGPLYGLRSQSGEGENANPAEWQAFVDSSNPFAASRLKGPVIASNCQFPQLTPGGLEDSITHGANLREVYGSKLGLSNSPTADEVIFRVTNNPLTSQVASGILKGFYPGHTYDISAPPVLIQPSSIDSLEPRYSCPQADSLRTSFTTGSNGSVWKAHLQRAHDDGTFRALDGVSGIRPDDSGWHVSFDHYFDNLNARQCHGKPLPCSVSNSSYCVSQQLADKVYEIGNWEYSYLYREAPGALRYAALKFGAWMLELESHLRGVVSGTSKVKYYHNIAHDGSISSLLGFLQVSKMAWPGMGSEVVFELYERPTPSNGWFVRVLWSGTIMETASPLGVLDMIPLEKFTDYIHSLVPSGEWLLAACS
ncbi:hypothetical protein H1R20_g12922, partial [Candolleomyces eurysporus]